MLKNLSNRGRQSPQKVHYQLTPSELLDDTLQKGQGILNDSGALVISTGQFTGRSPKDRFILRDEITQDAINWNEFNIPIEAK